MKKVDLKKLAQYADQYVAFSSSKIIAFGKSIKDVEKKLHKLDIRNVTIQYIPPLDKFVSPICL